MAHLNQKLLNKRVKEWYREHGDFISAYNESLGFVIKQELVQERVGKNNNLLYHAEE